MTDGWKNKLYYGDNLDILRRYIPNDSVDLVYLDPPFNNEAILLYYNQNSAVFRQAPVLGDSASKGALILLTLQ